MKKDYLLKTDLNRLLGEKPYLNDFFLSLGFKTPEKDVNLEKYLGSKSDEELAEFGLTKETLIVQCLDFIATMEEMAVDHRREVKEIIVKSGFDKDGNPEKQDLSFKKGEVVSVVGPTGSGKSRFLSDIECLAQCDTPSKRQILINGLIPDENIRLSGEHQLVAQLSQNMNFVVDLSVEEFITMHAESRLCSNIKLLVEQIYHTAVDLAGEPFSLQTPVTALSGGQSRALMIADVAHLSASPVVLIDEIENAGVDRLRALEILVKKEKIVLMATHDPLLALSGHRRIVIKNGGVVKVIETSDEEREGLIYLSSIDKKLAGLRDKVRKGEKVVFDFKDM